MTDEEYHTCHFCGEWVRNGKERDGTRHWLSDCRPDLVAHEPGPLCTWPHLVAIPEVSCYAYQDSDTGKFTKEHTHFYEDGPM